MYVAQRISSINSLSAVCEKTGANIEELSNAIGSDHRIGPYFLNASVGFGGSCFQKDILNLVYLCKYYGLNQVAEYWHQVVKINDYQKDRFAQKIINHFGGDLTMKTIGVLGWAFKANTNDSRESTIYITEKLYNSRAILSIYDPMVSKEKILDDIDNYWSDSANKSQINQSVIIKSNLNEAINEVDLIVILTEWDEFTRLETKKNIVFDGRGIVNNSFYTVGK